MKVPTSPDPFKVVSVFAASLSLLCAQEEGPDSTTALLDDSVIYSESLLKGQVRAFKTSTPILDVPQSITLISEEEMQDMGVTSIGDLVDYTPGVNTSQGEGHRDAVVFRGVRSTADFFVNGVRDDVQYYRPLYNVEQVEILRGPNALFFGRGGTGGVLNRVMKKAEIGQNFHQYEASVNSFGESLLQFDSNYSFQDDMAFRLNLHYDYLNNHRDYYDGYRYGANPTFTFQATEETQLRLSLEFMDHERFVDRGIPTGADGRPVEAFDEIVFGDSELNTTLLEAAVLRLEVDHKFSENWKGSATASFGNYNKFYQNFYVSGYDEAGSGDQVTLDGYADKTERQNALLSGHLIGEFTLGGVEHKLLVGGEYNWTSSDQDRYNAFWDRTSDDNEVFLIDNFRLRNGVGVNAAGEITTNSFSDPNDETQVDIQGFSFYLQDEIALNEYFDLILGARFDHFNIEVDNIENGEKRSRTDEEVSPRFGFVFKPVESVSLYGSYSESFLPQSGEQYANIDGDKNRLDPSTFSNLEFGLKWDLHSRLSLTFSAFQIEQSAPQVSDLDPSRFVTIESETKGLELQLKGQVTDRWFVSAGASYLDSEQVNEGSGTSLRPRELPEFTFSFWNKYQVNSKLGLGLGLIYQGESFVNNRNTAELPSYVRVDAAAYYQLSESFRAELHVENLFNTRYFPNAHSTDQVTVGAPLNARLGIVGRF